MLFKKLCTWITKRINMPTHPNTRIAKGINSLIDLQTRITKRINRKRGIRVSFFCLPIYYTNHTD